MARAARHGLQPHLPGALPGSRQAACCPPWCARRRWRPGTRAPLSRPPRPGSRRATQSRPRTRCGRVARRAGAAGGRQPPSCTPARRCAAAAQHGLRPPPPLCRARPHLAAPKRPPPRHRLTCRARRWPQTPPTQRSSNGARGRASRRDGSLAERGDGLLVKVGEGGQVVLQVAQALCGAWRRAGRRAGSGDGVRRGQSGRCEGAAALRCRSRRSGPCCCAPSPAGQRRQRPLAGIQAPAHRRSARCGRP